MFLFRSTGKQRGISNGVQLSSIKLSNWKKWLEKKKKEKIKCLQCKAIFHKERHRRHAKRCPALKKAKLAAAEKPAGLRVEAKCVTQEKSVPSCPTGTSHTSTRWTKSAFSDMFAKYSVEAAGHYGISYNIIDLHEERRNYRENTQLLVLK